MSLKNFINNSKQISINDLVRYVYVSDLIKNEYSMARRAYDNVPYTCFGLKGEVIEKHKKLSKFLRYLRKVDLTNLTS